MKCICFAASRLAPLPLGGPPLTLGTTVVNQAVVFTLTGVALRCSPILKY